jgi:hypothetical protein
MAIKNKVDLKSDADVYLPDNITEEISAGDVRQRIKDLADSTLNLIDGGLVIQAQAGYSTPITPSSNYAFATKKYVDDSVSGLGAFWGSITGTITNQTDLITYLSTNYAALGTNVAFTSVKINGTAGNGHLHMRWQSSVPSGTGNSTTVFAGSTGSMGFKIDGNAWADFIQFNSTTSRTYQLPNASGTIALTSNIPSLSGYALLDGSNTPFTGAIRFEPTSGTAVTAKAFSTQPIYVGRDSSNTERFRVNSTGLIDVYGTTNGYFLRAFAGANELNISEFSSRWGITGDNRPVTFGFINNQTFTLRATNGTFDFGNDTNGSAVRLQTVNNQNSLITVNGIKIGNNTDTAATAGAGSIRWTGSAFEGSNGSAWSALGGNAPYSFDEAMAASGITAQYGTANTAIFIRFVPKANITITKLYYYLTSAATDTIRIGIWSDTSGAPVTLLQQGNEATTGATTTGLRSVTITSQALTAGTTYWIGIKCDSGAANFGYRTGVFNSNIVRSGFNSGAFTSSPSAFSDSIGAYLAIGV